MGAVTPVRCKHDEPHGSFPPPFVQRSIHRVAAVRDPGMAPWPLDHLAPESE
jgi:hypothetical protein